MFRVYGFLLIGLLVSFFLPGPIFAVALTIFIITTFIMVIMAAFQTQDIVDESKRQWSNDNDEDDE